MPPIPKSLRASIDFLGALEVAILVRVLGVVFPGHGLALAVHGVAVGPLVALAPVGRRVERDVMLGLVLCMRGAEERKVLNRVAVSNWLRLRHLPISFLSTCLQLLPSS